MSSDETGLGLSVMLAVRLAVFVLVGVREGVRVFDVPNVGVSELLTMREEDADKDPVEVEVGLFVGDAVVVLPPPIIIGCSPRQ